MLDKKFLQEIDQYIEKNTASILQDIKSVVDIKSVNDTPQPNAPFGVGVKKALEKALEISNRLGLSSKNCEDMLGYAELVGQSEEYIAMLTHLDVVGEGEDWKFAPYDMAQKDGYIIGRGVSDDKGPAIITLYAAAFFKDKPLKYGIRAILGCDEETGMRDVVHYRDNYKSPMFGFSPDGCFPCCNGEKGCMSATIKSPAIFENIIEFTNGTATNVIPAKAEALLKYNGGAILQKEGIETVIKGDTILIKSVGIGGHAAMPEGTSNAISMLVNYIFNSSFINEQEHEYLKLLVALHSSTDGVGIGINATDDVFTPLTCVGSMTLFENKAISQTINIRYPKSITAQQIIQRANAVLQQYGAEFIVDSDSGYFYISDEQQEIKILVDTYNEIAGKNDKAFTIGGGTYARKFKNMVSYGVERQDDCHPDFIGSIHAPDEGIAVERLLQSLKVYIAAIAELMKV